MLDNRNNSPFKFNSFRVFFCILCSYSSFGNSVFAEDTSTVNGVVHFRGIPPNAMVVYFSDHHGGTQKQLEVDQIAKQFIAPYLVGRPGDDIVFKNSDSINHNIYISHPSTGEEIDLGVADPGVELHATVNWPLNSLINVGCKIHSQMKMQLLVTDSDYYKVLPLTRRNNLNLEFSIDDVPNNFNQLAIVFSDMAIPPLVLTLKPNDQVDTTINKGINSPKNKGSLSLTRTGP